MEVYETILCNHTKSRDAVFTRTERIGHPKNYKKIIKNGIILLFCVCVMTTFTPAEIWMNVKAIAAAGINVKYTGAKGDGVTDDTDAIQRAINQYDHVYIPDGKYMINVDQSLRPKTNQTITLGPHAILQAISSSSEKSSVILLGNVNHVIVSGGQIIGERNTHKGITGQHGMGILITNGAEYITIRDTVITDCWGDGVYAGGTRAVKNITLDHVVCDHNRRQGLSITNAEQVTIQQCIFSHSNGSFPECGIDIEPNDGNAVAGVAIRNTQCYGNANDGIVIDGGNSIVQGVAITDCTICDNGSSGIVMKGTNGLILKNVLTSNNHIGMEINHDVSGVKFINFEASDNQAEGVKLIGKNQTAGIEDISFIKSRFYDNGKNTENHTACVVIDNYDDTGYVRNIRFANCSFGNRQTEKTQRYAAMVGSSKTVGILVNIVINNCTFEGNRKGNFILN